jgi:hypothetical protein
MGMRDRLDPRTSAERRIAREQRSAARRVMAEQMRGAGGTLEQIGLALGVSHTRIGQIFAKAERLARRPAWHDAVDNTRALSFLRRLGLDAVPEAEAAMAVARLSRKELLSHENVGKGAVAALSDWLGRHALALSGDITTTDENKGPYTPASGSLASLNKPPGFRLGGDRGQSRGGGMDTVERSQPEASKPLDDPDRDGLP